MRKTIQRLASLLTCGSLLFALAACGGAPYSSANAGEPANAADTPAGDDGIREYSGDAEYYFADDYVEYGYNYDYSGENYQTITENRELQTAEEPLLTFSLKVDTASYTNVARYLENAQLPPADAVRTEELVNYFSYDMPLEFDDDMPFAVYTEIGPSIFNADKYMAFVRVKTKDIPKEELPPSSLTFLVDTSGSMSSADKMPLLVDSLKKLVEVLDERDTISIVTYAGSSEILLDGASCSEKDAILDVLNSLTTGGSTAGAAGITTAYELAEKNYLVNGNNRVILASDGDFNVGISNINALKEFIADKREESGVYLSVLGYGTGNLNDAIMETLATNGNGNYNYINSLKTAQKVLVDELAANLFTVADDVKAQVEFNPGTVASYRLIGYENRLLNTEDFNDDTVDSGEIGAGTDVVMLFEFTLCEGVTGGDLFDVNIRYKNPGESESRLVTTHTRWNEDLASGSNSSDFAFASAVAAFGAMLRGSSAAGEATLDTVIETALQNLGTDVARHRFDFVSLLYAFERL